QGQVIDLGDLVLDESPPSVASITPANGASGVPVATVIEVRFSEPVNPATIGPPNLLVSGSSGPIAGTWSLSPDQTRASFAPTAPLSYTFATLDTEPPVVQTLTATGGPSVFTITADVGGATDVAFVEFVVNEQLVLTQRSAPFTLALQITSGLGLAPKVKARA